MNQSKAIQIEMKIDHIIDLIDEEKDFLKQEALNNPFHLKRMDQIRNLAAQVSKSIQKEQRE